MSNSKPSRRRPAPFSIRLTESERAALLLRSVGLPLGFYVKQILFGDSLPGFRKPKAVLVDHAVLGRVLAGLGRSRLAQNLNQLAKAVHQGVLPVTEETEADLRRACEEVSEMRGLLLVALGIEKGDAGRRKPATDEPGAFK